MIQAERYIKNVLSGEELVSETTKLTILRHLGDLEKEKDPDYPFYFDRGEAQKAINFLRVLRHPSGEPGIARQKFKVQDNQAFLTACVFGWRRKESDRRRFTKVYFEVPRKWGKSLYAAFIEIYTGFYEGAVGAGVFTAATTRDQADEVFRAVKELAKMLREDSDSAKKSIHVMANSVNNSKSGCFIQKVSADAGNLDGKNPYCIVLDERHAHPNDDVKEVMVSGQATWECPMLFTITTAGFNKDGPCFKIDRPHSIAVLKGERRDDALFTMIFCHDTDDADGILQLDPDNPEEAVQIIKLAKKSNPNLGSTPTHNFILDRVRDARNKGGSTRVGVLTKNFNCWLDTPKIWIPEEEVLSSMAKLNEKEYEGRPCFMANDLAATADITASARFYPPHNGLRPAVFFKFWLPEDTIEKKKDDTSYRQWVEDGFILKTPGNVADYSFIRKSTKDFAETNRVRSISYDPWNSYQLATELKEEDGFEVLLCRQTYANSSEPLKWIEKSILSGEVDIDENPVLLWMFRNVVLDYDANDNIKLNKAKSANKIDGVSAFWMAVFGWLVAPAPVSSYLLEDDSQLLRL